MSRPFKCYYSLNMDGKFVGRPGEECHAPVTRVHERGLVISYEVNPLSGKRVDTSTVGGKSYYCEEHAKCLEKWVSTRPIRDDERIT